MVISPREKAVPAQQSTGELLDSSWRLTTTALKGLEDYFQEILFTDHRTLGITAKVKMAGRCWLN